MPVMKKELTLDDGRKVWVRQASGMEKLDIEVKQQRVFRKFRHFGSDPSEWSPEQHEQFAEALDDAGAGMTDQIKSWVPACIIDEGFDVDSLTSEELRTILMFVRGDTSEGAIPLASSVASPQ